ncbi:MAG: glutamine synthetase [Deltaproteobacteria bacterium]|nr:glutamine synthetase [Deltaproteobacteria bacterium]
MADIEQIQEMLRQADSTKIFFTDLNGRPMSLSINPKDIEKTLKNGIGFDGSSIAGYATVESSDRLIFPDPDSFRLVRFEDETLGFFVGRIYNEKKERAKADPRAVLEKVIEQAETEFGFRFLIGPEHEFFVLKSGKFGEDVHSDDAGYFQATPHDKGELVRKRIITILEECGIKFEKAHHEVSPSQHEINLECIDPLQGADRTLLFTHITHTAVQNLGYRATFMPKPFDGFNRNALHIHLSMQDMSGNNVFYEEGAENNIGNIAKHFIAGILKYARETSIIMASTFNSYKAYVLEREAPIVRNWGFTNRSSMVRIPYSDDPDSTRLELRNPDPAGNVYLQVAVLIAMGLDGLRNKLECAKPIVGSTYEKQYRIKVWDKRFLPKSMYEALVEAERSSFLKETLGEKLYDEYMSLKIKDWEEHRANITHREYAKYLSI